MSEKPSSKRERSEDGNATEDAGSERQAQLEAAREKLLQQQRVEAMGAYMAVFIRDRDSRDSVTASASSAAGYQRYRLHAESVAMEESHGGENDELRGTGPR